MSTAFLSREKSQRRRADREGGDTEGAEKRRIQTNGCSSNFSEQGKKIQKIQFRWVKKPSKCGSQRPGRVIFAERGWKIPVRKLSPGASENYVTRTRILNYRKYFVCLANFPGRTARQRWPKLANFGWPKLASQKKWLANLPKTGDHLCPKTGQHMCQKLATTCGVKLSTTGGPKVGPQKLANLCHHLQNGTLVQNFARQLLTIGPHYPHSEQSPQVLRLPLCQDYLINNSKRKQETKESSHEMKRAHLILLQTVFNPWT